MPDLVSIEYITSRIYYFRSFKVMLDRDLADLYGVDTAQLKRAVRRNIDRFPEDFMFILKNQEVRNLRCHFGTLEILIPRSGDTIFSATSAEKMSVVVPLKGALKRICVCLWLTILFFFSLTFNLSLTATNPVHAPGRRA